jgi:uncharacterized protein (TIGR00369 family)
MHADRFAPLPAERAAAWGWSGPWQDGFFPGLVGIVVEEVRADYARMRLPYRPALAQPAGVMHGGALATLLDTVVVPAVASAYDEPRRLATITTHIAYLDAVAREDVVAEGWVEKRGRTTVFCRAEARTTAGVLVCSASLVYKVGGPLGQAR